MTAVRPGHRRWTEPAAGRPRHGRNCVAAPQAVHQCTDAGTGRDTIRQVLSAHARSGEGCAAEPAHGPGAGEPAAVADWGAELAITTWPFVGDLALEHRQTSSGDGLTRAGQACPALPCPARAAAGVPPLPRPRSCRGPGPVAAQVLSRPRSFRDRALVQTRCRRAR